MAASKKAHRTGFIISAILISVALSLSCNLPQRRLTPPPEVTRTPNGFTSQPSLTKTLSPAVTPGSTQPPVFTDTPLVTPTLPTPDPLANARAPAQYDLTAVFDYYSHTLSASETIAYENLSSDPIDSLLLIIEPNLVPGGFLLDSITWEDGQTIDGFVLNENQMTIPLAQSLQPGGKIGIKVSYHLEIPQLADTSAPGRPEAYGYSDLQTNLVDWYPYVPPYVEGRGWLVHQPWDVGEYQVYGIADFNIDFSLAEPVDSLVIAASAPSLQVGDHYIYRLEAARSFAMSASTEYVVQTTSIDSVTIYSYSFPYNSDAGKEVLSNTAEAMQLFSRLLVPYPQTSLSIVEADFLDGMEYDGLFFLSYGFYNLYDGTPKGYLTFIAAHETAHQWWYGLIGNDQAMEPWLDEALSTYMEHIFYENYYLDYSPPSGGSLVNWWWYYRVYFYEPTGWVDSSIYYFSDSRGYRNAVYLDGAIFLDELRNLIGDQAFFATLRDYARSNMYSIATGSGFFSILRSHTSQDLFGLISTYFQTIK